jgi:PiT family inorganic phosphate transporter
LASNGLPTIPLVPVSSSQAVVGAVIGIGLIKGGSGIRWRVAANIASAWVTSPFISGTICFVGLFFVQNVFNQPVYRTVAYEISAPVLERLEVEGINTAPVLPLVGKLFAPAIEFKSAIEQRMDLNADDLKAFVRFAEINRIVVDARKFGQIDSGLLTENQRAAVGRLVGKSFDHSWMFDEALARLSAEWEIQPDTTLNKLGNRVLQEKRRALHLVFREEEEAP